MMRPLIASGLCLLIAPSAMAQQPFDMTPELYLRDTPAPVELEEIRPEAPAATPTPTPSLQRHLLPETGVRFEGEVGTRAFDFYLTEAQAAAPASLDMSMLNAIVVAPEYSNLSVSINGTELATTPIEFAAAPTPVSIDVPSGVLTAGQNRLQLGASQRHRTDCSVNSTYELWTDIYGAGTVLDFQGTDLGRVSSLAELPAIGLGAQGATELYFYVPERDDPRARTAALILAQKLALAIKAPAVEIELIDTFAERPETGALTVILGTVDALPEEAAAFSDQAGSGPVAGVIGTEELPNTIMISGPDWTAVDLAVRSIGDQLQPFETDLGGMRVDLADPVPIITGNSSVPLSQLGVDTIEFNGRRYHTALRFALPDDFYASMYSEAELVLDAAYSAAVEPGSQLDIYVNGQIAAVVPILRLDGGTFRNSRLRIPMTNFRAGINEMYVETILLTAEDQVCPPGLSGRAAARFLFSAESELAFPQFGRIASYPDLGVMSGTGGPYAGSGAVGLVMGEGNASLEASMTVLTRMALSSGRIIEANVVSSENLNPASNGLVIAPMNQLSADLLRRGRIVELGAGGNIPVVSNSDDALARWQESASPNSANVIDTVQRWLADQLDLAPENFWLFRRGDGAYLPQSPDAVILSQARQDEGGVWTVMTIPNEASFVAATDRLVSPGSWESVDGRISAVSANDDAVLVVQPVRHTLVPTQPLSLSNLRLIAANWLSTNVLGYAVLLSGAALLLTAATSLLLRLGRRRKT